MRTRVLSLLLVACNANSADDATTTAPSTATSTVDATAEVTTTAPSTADTSTTGEPDASTGEAASTADATSTPTTPTSTGDPTSGDESTGPPPEPPGVHYVGRHDATDPTHVRMGWSGVGAVLRFDGTDASVRLDDYGRYFTVLVDGQLQPNLATQPGEQLYPLAVGLPAGEHTIELYRRTEGSFGPTTILGFELTGELLAPPPVTRRIEVVGDSISCGYGNEGAAPCSFSAETENHYLTYGAVAARTLGAEISTVAWSGKGVIYNYDEDKFEPLPQLYDRLLAVDAAPWGFAWQPDVVVINLGTNDFSTGNDPPEDVFVPAYVAFLAHLRDVYPDAFLLPVAPSLFGAEVDLVAGYLQSAVDQRHAAGDADVAFADINVTWIGSGCDGHPSVETHAGMAARLVEELQVHLGW
jgi:lysophospholipase L1-like esterase